MKKRLFPILISLLMVFAMMPFSVVPAYADDPVTTTLGGVVYTLNENDQTAAVSNYTEDLPSSVTIPQSITHNGQSYNVTSIGSNAFKNCIIIDSITLPNSIQNIDSYAFMWSTVKSVTLPENLTSIGNMAFTYSGLESITIPASVTSIGSDAFEQITALTTVVFEDGSAITTLPAALFSGCKNMKSITLPEKLTSIEYRALNGLESLESITFPETLTTIGVAGLRNCNKITTIAIPASVTSIGEDAFENVPLNTVYFDGSKAQWDAITGDGKPMNVTVNFAKKDPVSINGASVALSATSYTYNANVQKPSIKTIKGLTLKEGTDYTAKWSNASSKNAGTYSVTITGQGDYTGTTTATYTINKAANPLKIKAKTATIKYSKLKKKAQPLAVTRVIKFTKKGQGKMSYSLSSAKKGSKSFKKYFKINKSTGKVTIKKNSKMKKGTYKVKVKVKALGNTNYKASGTKTVTFKVKVK